MKCRPFPFFRLRVAVLVSCGLLALLGAARAAETFGLAMHGEPKYGPKDTHLDYVNPDAPKGGTLKQAEIGTFDTLNPFSIKGKSAKGLTLVYDRLMGRVWDEPFTMYPLIAESYDMPEDRSAITFHIDPKARFHDGSPVTAEDVIFSFETLRDFGRPNMRRIYRLVTSVEKGGPRSVHFTFGDGYDRETALILSMMPVLSHAYWKGREFDSTTLETPLLNGPYRISSIEPGRRIIYERVPDYWAADLLPNAGQHNFDTIIYDYYRDDGVALEAFKAGDLNFRREYNIARWASAYDGPQRQNGDIILYAPGHERTDRTRAFVFNMRRAPFDDLKVRKALSLAFDYDWVEKTVYYGQYKRIMSYFPNSKLSGNGPVEPRTLALLTPWKDSLAPDIFAASLPAEKGSLRARLRDADRLLKESGWGVENGKRVKDGHPLTFEILIGAPEEEKIALSYKKSLERLGITLTVRLADAAGFQDRLNNYDFDMVSYFWQNTLSPGTEQLLYWSCEAADQPSRWNFSGICKKPLDHLAGAIAGAQTYEDLTAYAQAIDRILLTEHMAILLFYSGADYIASWKPLKHPANVPLYGVVPETWWMDPQ